MYLFNQLYLLPLTSICMLFHMALCTKWVKANCLTACHRALHPARESDLFVNKLLWVSSSRVDALSFKELLAWSRVTSKVGSFAMTFFGNNYLQLPKNSEQYLNGVSSGLDGCVSRTLDRHDTGNTHDWEHHQLLCFEVIQVLQYCSGTVTSRRLLISCIPMLVLAAVEFGGLRADQHWWQLSWHIELLYKQTGVLNQASYCAYQQDLPAQLCIAVMRSHVGPWRT